MRKFLLFLSLSSFFVPSKAQETYPVNGSHDVRPGNYAFVHATVVLKAGQVVKNATLLVHDKLIEAVGANERVPAGYQTVDVQGKFIYPSLIDAFTNYGTESGKGSVGIGGGYGRGPQIMTSTKNGPYGWNESIHPETRAIDGFVPDEKMKESLKKIGFGAVQSVIRDGIARGSGALVVLADDK